MRTLFIGETQITADRRSVTGGYVDLLGETYYQIRSYDAMPPFFMSLISSSDHWLFISSTGGLTAGRGNANRALFPYYTVDKVTENSENTGSKTILQVFNGEKVYLWEPFSARFTGSYDLERAIYKNIPGTSILFEETNLTLDLRFRYAWRTSEKFGFVRTAWLTSLGNNSQRIEILDGLQNILPANVTDQSQMTFSNLLDAYKRAELEPVSGLGIFSLSSTLTDMAEPSESLLATTVAQVGLGGTNYLLSSRQLDDFRAGRGIMPEIDVRGRRGAYFAHGFLDIEPQGGASWHIVADVCQDQVAIRALIEKLKARPQVVSSEIEADISENRSQIRRLVACSDGLQLTNCLPASAHHFANVVFNIMRGGVFPDQYLVERQDFIEFVRTRNRPVFAHYLSEFEQLPEHFPIEMLRELSKRGPDDLARVCSSYLPLSFSRRHGDPSRPWNRFNIQIKNPDGSRRLDYEGNWRDIFQNWEPLAYAFPDYIENMISVFLNATTVDGYNPYRITRDGIDWEKPEVGNPWSNIGYWSDHQIIYLQKLLEVSDRFHQGAVRELLDRPLFSYANVPYRIKPFEELLQDPFNTIQFDWDLEQKITAEEKTIGADAKMILDAGGRVYQVTLTEKLLSLLLGKLVNFVPEGGIWMNTQRPEWNDAHNALVGKGLSIVTLAYLRRFVAFFHGLLDGEPDGQVAISEEVLRVLNLVSGVLGRFQPLLASGFSPRQRLQVMEALGIAGSEFRWRFYENGLSFAKVRVDRSHLLAFLELVQEFIDQSLRANRRDDRLYHSYNTLRISADGAHVDHLYEMLEGQVAVLSSGMLSAPEALGLLHALRKSSLYRLDQHSYILYPDRELPGFLARNTVSPEDVHRIPLTRQLAEAGRNDLFSRDLHGAYHFNSAFRNARDVERVLSSLMDDASYRSRAKADAAQVRDLFEKTFNHAQFTGRSGTFFAYEGLGSIYWHMVSKLLLAAQEVALQHRFSPEGQKLAEMYRDIRDGLGFNKDPESYGAFPTDPYSHTPKSQGAKQPGMTGAVKEEILARIGEVGLFVQDGSLVFDATLVDEGELLDEELVFEWPDVDGVEQRMHLQPGQLVLTFCQVPVIVERRPENEIVVTFANGEIKEIGGSVLGREISREVFGRTGKVRTVKFGYADKSLMN